MVLIFEYLLPREFKKMSEESNEKISAFKKLCMGVQSQDRKIRKQTYLELQKFLSHTENFSHQDLRNIFTDTYMYTLNGLRDKTETVREQAITFIKFLYIDVLPLNDFYLTYLFPILVERIGSVEIIEESEEIRLQLLQLMNEIITKYSGTEQLKPFLNDSIIILSEAVKDKYPAIKEFSCHVILNLSKALNKDFHMQAETLVKPVLTCFNHQRFKVRVAAISAIGEIVMHSSYKGLDEAVGPLAEKLFDQIPIVRRTVADVAARWLLEYRDRYSFFHKILPLLLTGLNDEIEETRVEAALLWEKVGIQYQKENEKDLKDQMDFLYKPPKFYPKNVIRPNLGCRVLVKRNVSKISGALARELTSWQEDVRLRCSQLLCSIVLHAEEGITQNLQDLLLAMYTAARDEDHRVVDNIRRASEIIGCFVKFNTWFDLMESSINDFAHYGHLTVLSGIIEGSPKEYITDHVETLSKILAEDSVCCTRKDKFQIELLGCVRALLAKHSKGTTDSTAYNLFKICVTLISLRHPDNKDKITLDIFDEVAKTVDLNGTKELWSLYTRPLLQHIHRNVNLWTTVTDEECIFVTILLESREAFGENLDVIGDILIEQLVVENDAETRLKTFHVLATVFEQKEVIFRNTEGLTEFLERLTTDIFVPSLVWHAGATAEAIRTMAACCLRCALLPTPNVELFSASTLPEIMEKMVPLLISLLEDASYRSREMALECLTLLKENCVSKNIWTVEHFVKVYPEILRRLDDPIDKVRLNALKNLPGFFENVPEAFTKDNYRAHHELIINTLLIHFDDNDEKIQEMVYDILKVIAKINKAELLIKIRNQKSNLRNQEGCDRLVQHCESLEV